MSPHTTSPTAKEEALLLRSSTTPTTSEPSGFGFWTSSVLRSLGFTLEQSTCSFSSALPSGRPTKFSCSCPSSGTGNESV